MATTHNMRSFCFFLCLIALTLSCSNDLKTVKELTVKDKTPDEAAKDVKLTYSDAGVLVAIIHAKSLHRYYGENSYFDFPDGLKLLNYDKNGNLSMELTCKYAISYENTSIIEAKNNVVIKDLVKNDVLETEHIVWDQRGKRIYSNSFVKQTKADGSVSFGDGFDADERFSKYTVRNPRAEIITNDF